MDIQIVRANINDLDDIDNIEESLETRILSYNSLKDNLNDNTYYLYIAKKDNKLVGYISFVYLIDHIDIESIAVIPEFRKNNIATMLLKKLVEISKDLNICDIFLEVRKSNIPAINFYEKMGFKYISTRKKYYSNPIEDGFIYAKN